MVKKKKITLISGVLLPAIMVTGLSVFALENSLLGTRSVTNLNTQKVLEMNFDSGEIKNLVNNKLYSPTNQNSILVNSVKGKGFQSEGGIISIPFKDLGVTSADKTITVSFLMKHDSADKQYMPIGIRGADGGANDLYLLTTGSTYKFGFNTGQDEIYGVNNAFSSGEYVSVVAEFNQHDVSKNKLYINGEKRNLSYIYNSYSASTGWDGDSILGIGGIPKNDDYNGKSSIIDEVYVFKGSVTDEQAQKLALVHRIPELTVRQNGLNAQVDWATEILDSDLIYSYDFEAGDYIPKLTWNANISGDITGGQKVTTEEAYSGSQSIYTPRTIGGLGNHYGFPSTQSDRNIMMFNRHYFPNGTRLSVSFRVKDASGNNYISASGDGGWADSIYYKDIVYTESYPAGASQVTVNDLGGLKVGNYITSDANPIYGAEAPKQIREIISNSDGTYTLVLNGGFAYPVNKGDKVIIRDWRGAFSFGGKYHSLNDWQLINLNTSVLNHADYNVATRGGSFYINTQNEGDSYFDSLKFGYATRVNLYRDNNLIYDGYAATYNDTAAVDKASPIMGDISLKMDPVNSANKLLVSVNGTIDKGTTYNYSIKSIGNSGKETFKSENHEIDIVSGIKGYSYVLDKNPSTIPDNIVETSADSFEISLSNQGTYYLHIKVIDKAGNVSSVVHKKIEIPRLTASVNVTEDMIRLDWTEVLESTYKLYQKKPGSSIFQSISLTDFDNVDKVRVLNLYPYVASTVSCRTWDGEDVSVPASGSLKCWMEKPNAEHPKGYGKGVIEVTPIDMNEFNSNPSLYLKENADGWNYDVIMIGTWDANVRTDISSNAIDLVKKFIDSGRGILFGHDTIGYLSEMPNLRSLSSYLKLEPTGGKYYNGYNESGGAISGNVTSNVLIEKKGMLTNYPWEIGEIGTNLTVPITHSLGQKAFGDIWLRFDYNKIGMDDPSNFYLTTWNNAAMIQTGHSNGRATPDEQKILANTLFYLNQLSANNYLDDYSGQDVGAPTTPKLISSSVDEQGRVIMQFEPSQDIGSTYEYYVESASKDGALVSASNIVKETITTGLKGYSYVLDSNQTTEPDNVIEIQELSQMIFNKSDVGKYIHIKAIDNGRGEGNASETLHIRIEGLMLEANAQPNENMIRLDWTDMEESTYKLYQKKPGGDAFQTVGLTNFDTTKKINVLNVHPNVGTQISCTTWDGEKVAVPASASLKCWMEAPNSEHSKGYGKGIIEVDIVTIEKFNTNPELFLVDSYGGYKYDVIMFGTADNNGGKDLSLNALNSTKKFLEEGRGVLFGHDTVTEWNGRVNFPKLQEYINTRTYGFTGSPSQGAPNQIWTMPWSGGKTVEISKKGLLTNYPWDIGDIGSTLNIPYTHTNSQVAKGDVWLKFKNPISDTETNVPIEQEEYSDSGIGTNMAYLTTWNNAAMIQTGHAIGRYSATADEQKILANTLFYLNQLSTENYLNDYSGQDVAAPTKPSVKSISYTMDNKINVVINPSKDNGSTYEYYVESERKDGSFNATSNKVLETITTGFAGYSYVVDSNPITIPDNVVNTTSTTIQIPTNNTGKYYIHIKALDNVGNASETIHYELTDMTKPSLVVTANTTNWTNQDVVLTAIAQDNESGLKYIYLPNNTKVTKNSVTYTVSANGTYVFKAEDFMGNIQVVNKAVSNIDKIAPTGKIQIANGESKVQSEETTLTLGFRDDLSGVAKVEVFDLDANGNRLNPAHIINNPVETQVKIPWVLKDYDAGGGVQKARIGMIVTDKAGNSQRFVSQEVIVEKLRITGLTLTNVVNPAIYNKENPFTPLVHPNITPQKMVNGGSFKLKIDYEYSPTIPTSYHLNCTTNVYYVGPNGYNKVVPITKTNQPLTGSLELTHEIGFGIPNGTNVYIDIRIELITDTGRVYGEDFFPKPQGSRLQVGIIDGDIREMIHFNEIK